MPVPWPTSASVSLISASYVADVSDASVLATKIHSGLHFLTLTYSTI